MQPFPGTLFTQRFAEHSPLDVPTVLSLHLADSALLLAELWSTQLFPAHFHPWGSVQAYEHLLDSRCPMAVLDVPGSGWAEDLEHRIRVLSRLAPVSALVPAGTDTVPLFGANAQNVLDRRRPARQLAARLAADRLRRGTAETAAGGEHNSVSPVSPPYRGSQRVLLKLLLYRPGPWCCHDLRLLLGSASSHLSRHSLHARVLRLTPYAAAFGSDIHVGCRSGRTTYSTRPQAT